MKIAVIGAGVFGLASAIELASRGHEVSVFERGVTPHPDASSTDVAKSIRRTWYAGDNETYVELVERAAAQWRTWERASGKRFYHQVGGLSIVSRLANGEPMRAGVEFLRSRGSRIEVMSADESARRFPSLRVRDGELCVYDPWAGYIDGTAAMRVMAKAARSAGARLLESTHVRSVVERGSEIEIAWEGGSAAFERAVVAAGAWIGRLLPEIGAAVNVTRQQMVMVEPRDPDIFRHGSFPVWNVDPDGEGWYGFPLLSEGYLKVARDRPGEIVDPDVDRSASGEFVGEAVDILRERIPELSSGRIVESRSCLYTNTPDGHFIIDRAPGRERLFIAGGGSGHGFKFGGSIGAVVADCVEELDNSLGERFRIGDRLDAPRAEASRGFALSDPATG